MAIKELSSREVVALCVGERLYRTGPVCGCCAPPPEITWESADHLTMYDDCMSFPSLIVRLERARSISIHFQNEFGEWRDWDHLDTPTSELLQHELVHLNGVLAIDRTVDKSSIVMRETYSAMPDYFRRQVDYEIEIASAVE